ncbi:hypothetical protein V7087_13080 [Neobacillus niacini]|uniref:hypothetical protein n=1 Tax=Neobacillus niacini TaxID=86668 RepID=UPI002FFE7572
MKKLRERLKPLTLKGKIEYLIEYYSFHMIAVIVIIFFLIMGINTFTDQPKEILAVRVVGADINEEQTQRLQREFERLFIDSKRSPKEELSVISIDTSDAAGNSEKLAKFQKLAAEIAAKEVDVLLVDEETFHQFNEEGNLYDLSSINGIKDWKETKYSSSDAAITGIDVSNVSPFSSLAGSNQPLILAVLANTERIDEVKKLIHFLK